MKRDSHKTARTEPFNAHLLARSGDLKRALVELALSPRFSFELDKEFDASTRPGETLDEASATNIIDHFILRRRLADGRTVLEHFVAEHPELSEEERTMLLSWYDVVEGIFEIKRRTQGSLVMYNLVDELTYRARSNMGSIGLSRMRPGSFLITRLVPFDDEWLLSGMSSNYPAENRADMYRAAVELTQQRPALMFRNPELLELGWELQREERRIFIDYFGADLIVVLGRELSDRMRGYTHYRMYEARDDEGKSAAERSRETYGTEPPPLHWELPGYFADADTVALIYDEIEGFNFYANFGTLQEVFADPQLAKKRHYRIALQEFLDEESVSTLPFRRLAAKDTDNASRVFQIYLGEPDFDWERDGEELLLRHKPTYFENPMLPGITPLSENLSRAQRQIAEADAAPVLRTEGSRHKRPKRRGGRFG